MTKLEGNLTYGNDGVMFTVLPQDKHGIVKIGNSFKTVWWENI